MAHKPFHLQRRPTTKKNKYIYYVQFYDEVEKRCTAISSGQTSKAAAERWAIDRLKKGFLPLNSHLTFDRYASKWWIWGECAYIKGKLARGAFISKGYAATERSYLLNHLIPHFGHHRIANITPLMVDQFILDLYDHAALSPTTINNILKCLKVMMREAERLQYIPIDPTRNIVALKEKPRERTFLSLDEVEMLFAPKTVPLVWDERWNHYTFNLIAATTGMRMGEIQGLQVQHVQDNYIEIVQSWARRHGLKEPKWNSTRTVPIPTKVSTLVKRIIDDLPYRELDDFVFQSRSSRDKPINNRVILDPLYKAFRKIGISENEREGTLLFTLGVISSTPYAGEEYRMQSSKESRGTNLSVCWNTIRDSNSTIIEKSYRFKKKSYRRELCPILLTLWEIY